MRRLARVLLPVAVVMPAAPVIAVAGAVTVAVVVEAQAPAKTTEQADWYCTWWDDQQFWECYWY